MDVKQFSFGDTNLAYLVWNKGKAAAIDGGAADEILAFCREKGLQLELVLNTHNHDDHTPGNARLLQNSSADYLAPEDAVRAGVIILGEEKIKTLATPGHTMDSLVYFADDWIITGDTLFNGTVGNCYTKNYELYFDSLSKLLAFPKSSRLYAGHDLVDYAVGVIKKIDPENPHLIRYVKSYKKDDIWTTLEMELQVNPFIPKDDPRLDPFRRTLEMPAATPFEKWRAMMSVH